MLLTIIILGVFITTVALIWYFRTKGFRPTADKKIQQDRLNADLRPSGFAHELRGDYFYALMDCWQREVGYCQLYDSGAPLFNMVMDCEPVAFYYGGKRWLIELWKGQYGITTGAEIGIYNTARPDLDTEYVKGTFFENISDAERLPLSFVLRKNGKVLLKRKALHWWLTAFRLGEFSRIDTLTMDAKIKFPNREMCNAFLSSLQSLGYRSREYSVHSTTVQIHFTKPHSPQPDSQTNLQADVVQQLNENNCNLYRFSTSKYTDSLDQLEYLKTAMPELYHFFLESLYAKGFFAAFDLIRKALFEQDQHPGKPGKPEKPRPPCPCASCPPCKPCATCKPCQPCECGREEPPCCR